MNNTELAARIAEGVMQWGCKVCDPELPGSVPGLLDACEYPFMLCSTRSGKCYLYRSLEQAEKWTPEEWDIEDPAVMVEIKQAMVDRGWQVRTWSTMSKHWWCEVDTDPLSMPRKPSVSLWADTEPLAVAHAAAKAVEGER